MKVIHDVSSGQWYHYCPACESLHNFAVDKPFSNGARWTFDGNVDQPSFNPSMNIRIGPYPTEEDNPKSGMIEVCHYFLKNGKLQYLGDCTHSRANSTVDLPDMPEKYNLFIETLKKRVANLQNSC